MVEIAQLVIFATCTTLLIFMSYGIITYGWGASKKPKGHLITEVLLILVLCAANFVVGHYIFATVWGVLFLFNLLLIDAKSNEA